MSYKLIFKNSYFMLFKKKIYVCYFLALRKYLKIIFEIKIKIKARFSFPRKKNRKKIIYSMFGCSKKSEENQI